MVRNSKCDTWTNNCDNKSKLWKYSVECNISKGTTFLLQVQGLQTITAFNEIILSENGVLTFLNLRGLNIIVARVL